MLRDILADAEVYARPFQGKHLPPGRFRRLLLTLSSQKEIEVVYCYEIHLKPTLQRKGLGEILIRAMEAIGASIGVKMAMLTVFVANEAAIKFYKRNGYFWYDEEPLPPRKKLRGRLTEQPKPTYVILAKDLVASEESVKS